MPPFYLPLLLHPRAAYPVLGIYSWFGSSTTNAAVYCTFISPIIALIEVPTCCACFSELYT